VISDKIRDKQLNHVKITLMSIEHILETLKQSSYYNDHLCALKETRKSSFSGLIGSSQALILSALAQDFKNILIITANTDRAQVLKSEIGLFSEQTVRLFPAPDILPGEELKPSQEIIGERLTVLNSWDSGDKGIVIAPVEAIMWKTNQKLENIKIAVKQVIRIDCLIEQLILLGYKRFDIVGGRGEFSVRGGIIDIFALNSDQPMRLEFVGDKIESLRSFDAHTQRSINKIAQIIILPARERFEVPLFDHLPEDTLVVLAEKLMVEQAAQKHLDEAKGYLSFAEILTLIESYRNLECSTFLDPHSNPYFSAPQDYLNKIEAISPETIVISKHATRIREEIVAQVIEGSLGGGFVFEEKTILSDKELFGEKVVLKKVSPIVNEGVSDELLADLKPGDFVVHENYGIAVFLGMTKIKIEELDQEYLALGFAESVKVYVPPSQAGLVEKYAGVGEYQPKLSRLGTPAWQKTKSQVKKRLRDMTKELLELYAVREKQPGFIYPADDLWQKELANTFPYEETPDQHRAIAETNKEMESERPMDRLVCGDVGYGKTEVAIRAAAKAVSAGKQVAVLAPTTILTEQHYNNFKERFHSSPFVIEMLSRFRSKKEQAVTVKALEQGGVDIVIGTHRLLSKDVRFKDLGLLVIDEEQRFGVGHKEKLKRLKKNVDVLTLTATPIPRTLYLSLAGIRSMSTITTPPLDRSPIRTYVVPWSEAVIREAILRELDRGGQIYFLHNFVETIEGFAAKIKKLVPEAKVSVAHGQMPPRVLEKRMIDFMERKYDLLICTSIIESGLDITNVNTILIDRAERFGLSQLYQIRGRVGRSAVRAYAYLFYHPEKVITDQAMERLTAIQEFTSLGSGYKLAMRDLEIRGAGNLLGAEQSGHILEVGFDLYCELLEQAVREVKGIKEVTPREVQIDLKVNAFIPRDYITDDRQRIAMYRRLNLAETKQALEELKVELCDRFGAVPDNLLNLFKILDLKIKAMKAQVKSVKEQGNKIVIEWLSGKYKQLEVRGRDKISLVSVNILR